MKQRQSLDVQEALICTMILIGAAERGGISDREIGVMSGIVQTLPVFKHVTADRLSAANEAVVELLREEDGLAHAGRLIRESLEPRLRETAYALACEVVAADRSTDQSVLQMLELIASELRLDPLVIAAIERGARARYQESERS